MKASDHLMLAQLESAAAGFCELVAERKSGELREELHERASQHRSRAEVDGRAAQAAEEQK
jgi:hypothetical protein